jgi:hypothetical protein
LPAVFTAVGGAHLRAGGVVHAQLDDEVGAGALARHHDQLVARLVAQADRLVAGGGDGRHLRPGAGSTTGRAAHQAQAVGAGVVLDVHDEQRAVRHARDDPALQAAPVLVRVAGAVAVAVMFSQPSQMGVTVVVAAAFGVSVGSAGVLKP